MNGNYFLGLLAGFVAALVGAFIWAVITVVTGFQIGFMAIGVGLLVGFAVRIAGQGYGTLYGFTGAWLALFGCLLGNLWTIAGILAQQPDVEVGAFEIGWNILWNFTAWPELLSMTFSFMDLIFYAIAVWEGWKFASLDGEDFGE